MTVGVNINVMIIIIITGVSLIFSYRNNNQTLIEAHNQIVKGHNLNFDILPIFYKKQRHDILGHLFDRLLPFLN